MRDSTRTPLHPAQSYISAPSVPPAAASSSEEGDRAPSDLPPVASHYSWLARSGFILAALLIVGCAQADTRVVAYSYQTTQEGAVRVAAEGPVHLEEIPAYYLVAEDKAQCAVDSTAYVAAKPGSRVACDWSGQ